MKALDLIALYYVRLIKLFRTTVINVLTKVLFKKKAKYKKILINRDGAFGDAIVALPAISIVRQNYPNAQIDLLSVDNGAVSFSDLGLAKGLLNNLYLIKKQQRKETLKTLKEQAYDLFIQIPQNIGVYKSIRNILLVKFYLNIDSAFGWDSGRVKSFMRIQKKYESIPTETMRFINALNKNNITGDLHYPLTSAQPTDEDINNLLATTKPVLFLIGGKLQPKKWPLDHWVSLSKLIGKEQKILIIGGDSETRDGEYIESRTSNTINVCGELSIPQLLHVLKKAHAVISLDTGAMHLCDAIGTKTIALFSTRDLSNKWFPNNKNSIVIEKVLHCSFCLKTECENNICMSEILPGEVYSKLNAILSG